jgi:uncharacterized protein (DUF1697 family)
MRYIAFLRAINVGGHIVKMDALRKAFQAMGFANVETFIASGNVIFETRSADDASIERKIEAHLKKALGYEVGTFMRTCAEVAAAAAHEPFAVKNDCAVYLVFLKTAPDRALTQRVMTLRSDADDFHARGRELYWQSRGRISESPAAVPFAKAFGALGTMRNLTTVRKLAAKYRE